MKVDRKTLGRAKALRRNLTDAERILWTKLKGKQVNGWHFRKQHPIGKYIVDFACARGRVILEVDGDTHARPDAIQYDDARTQFLTTEGWTVYRIWNRDIYTNLNAVMDGIYAQLPPPSR